MLWYPSKLKRPRRKENAGARTYKPKKGCAVPIKFRDALPTRVKRRMATPKWITMAHRRDMGSIYRYAVKLTRETGISYQVDHIEPLYNENSCGLHVPWNLRVVTELENQKKGKNRIENYISPWCVFPTPIH